MVMACVKNEIHGVDFTSRYRWESRSLLDSGDCPRATCKSHFCLNCKTLVIIHASVQKVTRQGNVKVSLGEDQRSKWEDTPTCDTGSIAYRKGLSHIITFDNHLR